MKTWIEKQKEEQIALAKQLDADADRYASAPFMTEVVSEMRRTSIKILERQGIRFSLV